MSNPSALSRSGSHGRVYVMLGAAMALVAAFVFAPRLLAGIGSGGGFADERDLTEALRAAFVQYWNSGDRQLSPGLESVVDYWFRYHVAKAVIAAALLVVLVMLSVSLWRAYLRADGRRAGIASAGVGVTMLAVFALVTVMANVQGAIAPYASMLPMLTSDAPDGPLAETLHEARQGLSGGPTAPALDAMISDFSRYHAAMVLVTALVAVGLIGTSVLAWRRYAGADRRTRRVLGSFGAASLALTLIMLVVLVANATTVADPGPALLAFFDGGW